MVATILFGSDFAVATILAYTPTASDRIGSAVLAQDALDENTQARPGPVAVGPVDADVGLQALQRSMRDDLQRILRGMVNTGYRPSEAQDLGRR